MAAGSTGNGLADSLARQLAESSRAADGKGKREDGKRTQLLLPGSPTDCRNCSYAEPSPQCSLRIAIGTTECAGDAACASRAISASGASTLRSQSCGYAGARLIDDPIARRLAFQLVECRWFGRSESGGIAGRPDETGFHREAIHRAEGGERDQVLAEGHCHLLSAHRREASATDRRIQRTGRHADRKHQNGEIESAQGSGVAGIEP